MHVKFHFMGLFFLIIHVTIVNSYGDAQVTYNEQPIRVLPEENHAESMDDQIKSQRVKRADPAVPTAPTPSPSYIITSFTTQEVSTMPMSTGPTTQLTNQTNAITSNGRITTYRPSNPTIVSSPYNPDTCSMVNYVKYFNNTCINKTDALMMAVGFLRNGSRNATSLANALSLYISSITNSTIVLNKTNTLSIPDLENIVDEMNETNLTVDSNTSFIMAKHPRQNDIITILGASFKHGIGGEVVDISNKDTIINSNVSAAAFVSEDSLKDAISLNMVIIDTPTAYDDADNSSNKTLSSSVILANIQRNGSAHHRVNISLYFYAPVNSNGSYLCSFFNTNSSAWNETGCTTPIYNTLYNRYECSCNHLTCFALLWLPDSLLTGNSSTNFDAEDITSLAFLLLSILCFLFIIIHAITIRILTPLLGVRALNLLPLISTASTTIFFIFYIALTMTVRLQTSSSTQTDCFLSSSILMFLTYFFMIYMFCIKTSVGYFYYERFVRLFPQPSYRKLLVMCLISFLIALACVALAIGFNFKSSFDITALVPYKICWFTRSVIYYFLTVPTGIFLLLNSISIVLVARSLIVHAFQVDNSRQINERLKRCVLVLLSSCVTQGLGWSFGPLITFASSSTATVLEWLFIVFNGLEGLWSILLYVLIRSQSIDEQKHVSAAIELSKSSESTASKGKQFNDNLQDEHRKIDGQMIRRKTGREERYLSDDFKVLSK